MRALAAIRGYQRFLSPLKGFSCALRVFTGDESCSAYGDRVIENSRRPREGGGPC
jgi:putative component of membrane protein insertase Oxa1/YidC/SpoIIIJ protein YidD